jgi:O-antigen/teichoic acid export membrane protein
MMRKVQEWLKLLNNDILLTVGSRFLLLFFGFANSIIYARFLGPEGRGVVFLVITIATAIVQFGNLGLYASNTYLVARDKSVLGGLIANSVWVSLWVGGISLVTVLVMQLLRYSAGVSGSYLWFAAAFAPPILFYMLGVNLLVGVNRFKTFNLFEIANRSVNFAFILLAGFFSLKVEGFLGLSLVANILVGIALWWLLKRSYGDGFHFRTSLFGSGFHYATKAYLIALLGFLVFRGNVFLLKRFGGFDQLGYVSICFNLVEVMIILPTSVGLVIFPNLVRQQAEKWKITFKNTVIVGILMLIACLVLAIIAKPFIAFIFGARFLPAVPILYWMLPGILFLSMISILSQYLAASGFPPLLVGVWLLALVIVLTMGCFLIPDLKGVGVALSFSAGYAWLFVSILGLTWFTRHQTR